MDAIDELISIAHRVVWATVATVDRDNRPRSRVLHPIWVRDGDRATRLGDHPADAAQARAPRPQRGTRRSPTGTRRTMSPSPSAPPRWEHDAAVRAGVWQRFLDAPEPLGYDFAQIFPEGPQSAGAGFLRLDPWRIRTHRVREPARRRSSGAPGRSAERARRRRARTRRPRRTPPSGRPGRFALSEHPLELGQRGGRRGGDDAGARAVALDAEVLRHAVGDAPARSGRSAARSCSLQRRRRVDHAAPALLGGVVAVHLGDDPRDEVAQHVERRLALRRGRAAAPRTRRRTCRSRGRRRPPWWGSRRRRCAARCRRRRRCRRSSRARSRARRTAPSPARRSARASAASCARAARSSVPMA